MNLSPHWHFDWLMSISKDHMNVRECNFAQEFNCQSQLSWRKNALALRCLSASAHRSAQPCNTFNIGWTHWKGIRNESRNRTGPEHSASTNTVRLFSDGLVSVSLFALGTWTQAPYTRAVVPGHTPMHTSTSPPGHIATSWKRSFYHFCRKYRVFFYTLPPLKS